MASQVDVLIRDQAGRQALAGGIDLAKKTVEKKAKKRAKKKRPNSATMKIARALHTAFERRMLGAYSMVLSGLTTLDGKWAELRPVVKELRDTKPKTTIEGMQALRRLLRSVHGHVSNVKSSAQHTMERVSTTTSALGRTMDRSSGLTLPTLSDCYNQVEAIKRSFGGCRLSPKGGKLIFKSAQVKLGKCDFGQYRVAIDLKKIASDNRTFYSVAPDPKKKIVIGGCCHPNVSNGHLCEGGGSSALTLAYYDGRIYDCCQMIDSTLRTYGSNSPYMCLDAFEHGGQAKYSCYVCGIALYPDMTTVRCSACNHRMCTNCATTCELGKATPCENCIRYAKEENRPSCDGKCTKVGQKGCLVRVDPKCDTCGSPYNPSVALQCEIISNQPPICPGCATIMAEAKTSCNECTMHGVIGCALVTRGYPLLDTLNHPAFVRSRGKSHSHHELGMHSVTLYHTAQKDDQARWDFDAYQMHITRLGGRDRSRAAGGAVVTATREERDALESVEAS